MGGKGEDYQEGGVGERSEGQGFLEPRWPGSAQATVQTDTHCRLGSPNPPTQIQTYVI